MKIYSVTEVLGKYFDWSKIPDQVLAEACTRGSLVHSACAARALGGYVGRLPGMYAGYYESFCTWHANNVKATVFCEHRITCEKFGFTGQMDFVFLLNSNEFALVDVKTPIALGKSWKCQLAAYEYLLGTKDFEVDSIMSLRLKMSGGAALGERYDGERVSSFNVFLSALNAHRSLI